MAEVAAVPSSDVIPSSHYRVCLVHVPGPTAPNRFCRPEGVYQPLPLTHAAATALIKAGLHRVAVNPDVRDLIASLEAEPPQRHIHKLRACSEVTYLRVGNFDDFPGARDAVNPAVFSTNIIAQARSVLTFLHTTHGHDLGMDDPKRLNLIVRQRYPMFLELQAKHMDEPLVPPIDVACAWLSHMLNSSEYPKYAALIHRGLEWIPHPAVVCVTTEAWEAAERRCHELWKCTYPTEAWSLPSYAPPTERKALQHSPTPKDIADDRMWIREFIRICPGPVAAYTTDAFLFKCVRGYQRYLYLLAKHTERTEFEGFSPPPPIDLIWHTHLLQPAVYHVDAMRLIGQVHHHKLLPESKRLLAVFNDSGKMPVEKEQILWQKEFDESLRQYVQRTLRVSNSSYPATVTECIEARVCTWRATFQTSSVQTLYSCAACKCTVCDSCARRCHLAHELTRMRASAGWCACGQGPACSARLPC